MSFRLPGTRGKTIRWEIVATKTLDDGTVQNIDLTLAGTKLIAIGKLTPADAQPVFTKDYYQGGGAPNGGIIVPAPGTGATNIALITIPPNEPGILALTKTSYVMVDVELVEPDGTETSIATGVIKVRYGVGQ